MEKHEKWNDISEELYESIPKLKQNQIVKFQMLNGAKNNHPESKERDKQPVIYPKMNINFKERIFDPTKGKRGEYVQIGIWTNLDKDGKPENFLSFMPWAGQHPYTGTFFLIGGRDRDDEMFEFLFLSNHRKDNPNRDSTHEPLFEMTDVNKSAIQKTKQGNNMRKALNAVDDMSAADMEEFAAGLLWPADWDEVILTGKLTELAMADPEHFMKLYGSPDTKIKNVIGRAYQMGIIKYDVQTSKVSYGKDVLIAKIEVEEGKTWIEAFTEWIKTHKDGNKALGNIKQQLKDSAPAVTEQG